MGREPLFHAIWAARYVEPRVCEPLRPTVVMAERYEITPKPADATVSKRAIIDAHRI